MPWDVSFINENRPIVNRAQIEKKADSGIQMMSLLDPSHVLWPRVIGQLEEGAKIGHLTSLYGLGVAQKRKKFLRWFFVFQKRC